ncbi:MAG: DUF1549 domain-containing protein, partial [Verrucomicrobiales bacterium]|nr:DUF1549 domain-containing protein [Verrucomicrobiales bacterium]
MCDVIKGRILVLVGLGMAAVGTGWAGEVSYSRDVRAILSDKCFKCHGFDPKTREGDLRLDVKEGEEGSAGVLLAGDSEVLARIFSDDPDEVMPPASAKKPLSEAQKVVLKQWVAEGADYEAHWAFEKIERPGVPVPVDGEWGINGVDRFVRRGLEERGMRPSAEAGRWALVRRVYLDLIGLPPSVEEAEAFVDDERPDAYERLVDDLLGRDAYGERWARRWLDLARYADTNGYEKDRPRSIWPYRDWVIGALNGGMGFDEFTVKQLAGDLLPGATQDDVVATGFHRNTMLNEEGGIDPLEFRFYSMTDRVGTTGTAWLGLTVACAQCHTHKYDPISHKEYYGLMAYLNNADEPEVRVWSDELRAAHARAEAEAEEMAGRLAESWPRKEKVVWQTVTKPDVRSEGGAAVEVLDGGVVVFGGAVPDTDVGVFEFVVEGGVERLRLEALPVGKSGPGRTAHGNFVVTEIEVKAGPVGGEMKRVELAGATADFSQRGYDAGGAVDGKAETGWAVDGDGRRHEQRELVVEL